MRNTSVVLGASLVVIALTSGVAGADAHFDIAPYLQDGRLLTGGLDHSGNHTAPPIAVYGFEFGEDPGDPFNPSDPGVNQEAGVGNLPGGAALRYSILSSLLYWDGAGDVAFAAPPGDAYLTLLVGSQMRTLTGGSGGQAGGLIQTVLSDGSVHKHFTTSLYAQSGAGNVPNIADPTYIEPAAGVYALSLELTLDSGGPTYASDPLWVVFNNGMGEEVHDAAMAALVPEPAALSLLALGGAGMLRRRRRASGR